MDDVQETASLLLPLHCIVCCIQELMMTD